MGSIEVSIIDAANPLVFVKAEDLGLSGKELPEEINADEGKAGTFGNSKRSCCC